MHHKVDNEWKNYSYEKKKVEADKEIYMRHRQSFMATKVNLQEMELQDHLFSSMSSFYGLATEKKHSNQEQVVSSTLRHNNSTPANNNLSHSERKNNAESYGVILPNVQKGQYKRYDRYKKPKAGGRD